jgi:hypothetical protein
MSDTSTPVRVFIGSGEASLLERKVLIHSLRKNSDCPLDIWVVNGTHNAIERNQDPPVPVPLSLALKYRNTTEFSLYRYLIPALCNFSGRAIYLDSDMICIGNIREMFETSLGDHDFLAVPEYNSAHWTTSVMLINCERARFPLNDIFAEIDSGHYSYRDFSRFSPAFCSLRNYSIGSLDPHWNVFDRVDSMTRLVHYTNLLSQPWKFPDHPFGDIWFDYFNQAIEAGLIKPGDIELSLSRGYARQDILRGNSPVGIAGKLLRKILKRLS